ncbi:substrate-binding periplasmic protein [Ideonella alba]|uniref:Transporter substrate-binding domain-containing protein n=1 Tax=Ideonella alba TaxID=2824118 RepID=A0A940YB13_9BURK|nr:transporter substrate-binding domain-containing protein [Ideonella alba]MBQ0932233.1 transporter substrate-binding domain-containing protein [Ideonella alba]
MSRHLPTRLTRRDWLASSAAATLSAAAPLRAQEAPALERLRARGSLIVGVYQDLPPFHVAGRGIEVDLAGALAAALGLKLSLLPFQAGEDMGDDLRNMVWKGHYLGFGPADVMLHVPVDRPLMDKSPQVKILAPYWRERVMVARDLKALPTLDSLDPLLGKAVAVPGQSLAGWLLIGAEGGRYRDSLRTKYADGVEAAQALARGEVVAAAGHLSELESTLGGDERFAIEPLPLPRMKDGWAVGMAVKAASTDLAQALQAAVNTLADNGELSRIFAAGKLRWRRP